MNAVFDPQAFLNSTLPGANSTKREIVSPGVYPAAISNLEIKNGVVQKDGPNYGKPWVALNFRWNIRNEPINAVMGQETVVVFDSCFLELDEAGGVAMGKGKNVQLGKLREAIGLNTGPIQFAALDGRVAKINVINEPYKDDIQAKVTGYAKA